MNVAKDNTVLFHTRNYTFHVAVETVGTFPPDGIKWYHLCRLPSVRLASRTLDSSQCPTVSLPESVLLCCWFDHPDGRHLFSDVYQYFIPPEESIRCLNIHNGIWGLDLDLQVFVVVNNRMYIMGYDAPPGHEDVEDDTDPVWDVCVEISAAALLGQAEVGCSPNSFTIVVHHSISCRAKFQHAHKNLGDGKIRIQVPVSSSNFF